MTASYNDKAVLSNDLLFQGRVRESLVTACISIANETNTPPLHFRAVKASMILASIELSSGTMPVWVQRFSASVATDANVIADATQGGTVALTTANVDTQQALVTDAHIDAAISSQFNTFFVVM